MVIPKLLKDEILNYCSVNNILNIDDFTVKLIKQGFTVEKFGATPVATQKVVENIVEKIVEVPIEKIVEKIVEIPITMFDTELSEKCKELIKFNEELKLELFKMTDLSEVLKEQLEQEKNKKQKDIYGE